MYKRKWYLRVFCNDQCILINEYMDDFKNTCIRAGGPSAVGFQHSYLVVKVL